MLNAMRSATKSWWVRGLLIILASTFALFFGSSGRIFSGIGNQPVAEVGRSEISQQEFVTAYQRQLGRLQGITPDQARAIGMPANVLGQMIGSALIDNAARDLGLAVSDRLLAGEIRRQFPGFTNNLYELALRQQGYTPAQFEFLVRQEMARSIVADTIAAALPAPRILAETMYRYREEQRVAEVLTIPARFVTEFEPPDNARLAEYYGVNVLRYTAPEYRAIAFVTLQREHVMDTLVVTEAEVVAEYEDRIGEFTTVANRGISELFFPDEETARAAQARLDAGTPFATADPRALRADPFLAPAEDAAPEPDLADAGPVGVIDRGQLTLTQLPVDVRDAVFALEVGAISPPLQSAEGWHLYRIDSVEFGGTLTLEAVHDQVSQDLLRDRALTVLYELSIDLDDALAGGDSLEQAANRLGLLVGAATVDAQGHDRSDQLATGVPPFANFLTTAFATRPATESLVVEAIEGGYFVLRVDGVELPAPLPFGEVTERVRQDWVGAEQDRLTEALAADLFERADLGTDLATLAAETGIPLTMAGPITRQGATGTGVPLRLIGEIFAADLGSAVRATATGGGIAIARLTEIVPADPAADPEAVAPLREEFSQIMSQDLLTQYEGALEGRFGVTVDTGAFDRATLAATSNFGPAPLPVNNPMGGF